MEVRQTNMHPLATTTHFNATRTDDDITATVSQFLQTEGKRLHGKTWQETTVEVTQWLGSQIQKEREGWTHKTRAAMQEIENHRRETLKFQGVLQECTDQIRQVVVNCNIPEDVVRTIGDQDARYALPLYIECLTGILNSLVEDRVMCLQILRAEEKSSMMTLPSLLKAYIESLKHHAEQAHKAAKSRLESLESANKQCHGEVAKFKKMVSRKQEEIDKLHGKLQEIKDVTIKKFKEVNDLKEEKVKLDKELDEKAAQTEIVPVNRSRPLSTPSSHYSAPTPTLAMLDEDGIKISEEKLSRLKRSAKKLEHSLNDALSQMDTFRQEVSPTKYPQSTLFSGGSTPFSLANMTEMPTYLKKDIKLLPSPLHTWSTHFEVKAHKERDKERQQALALAQERDQMKLDKKQRAKVRRKEAAVRSQEKWTASQERPTFRSLMKSLDEVKRIKTRNFKPVGQVTKCLRCNKLFTLNDNHKKACNYHPKGKERIEQYNDRGKLVKVSYVWKCCMSGPDSPGCSFGQHI